ncbi:hypothetical protein SAMN04488000_10576 [Lentzea albida]|uniref:NAD(+)--protein-arginine ADP-ribosyltransferase n=1 Tax=Lentzea albida TaxID=65499 RepID=A0A1H9JWQ9_9PSEU|nr:hypothetical protein SAMN04488000_10576 [Lentzea albida]
MGRRAAAHGDQQTQTQNPGQSSFGVQTITSAPDQDLDPYPVEQPPAATPQPEPVPQRQPFAANLVGATLVVSAPEGPSQGAQGLARALPADAGRTVVVVDFPGGDQSTFWPHVVTALHGRGPVRLAVSHAGSMRPTAPAQWLSEQLQAEVVAPDGVLTTVPGAAFVVGTQGYGSWVKFQPNASPMPFGRRFPVPQWEAMDPNSPWPTGEIGISEPIPSGLWLRAQNPPFDPASQDSRPIVALPCRDNVLTVVVGGPGQSSIPIDEVCRLLTALPQAARSRVRLVPYGVDAGIVSRVADQIGEPIAMFTGLPVGSVRGGGPAVIAVDPRGQQTWRPFVTEVLCVPNESVPVVSGYRTPVQGLNEVSPGVFALGDGVVLEVVPSGLWVREQDEPYNAAEVRTQPLDPEWARLTVGTPGRTTPGAVAVHGAALVERLEPEVRKLLRLVFCDSKVTAPPPPPPVSEPVPTPSAQIVSALSGAAHAKRDSADGGTGFFTPATPVESEAERPAYASMSAGPAMAAVTSHALDDPDEAAFPSDDPDSTPIRFRVDGPLPLQPLAMWEIPPEDNGERETVSRDHSSSDAERDTVRRALGERYGAHAATVVRLLSQRPDAEEDPAAFEAMVTDLTALLACVSQDEDMVVETLRMGRLGRLRPYVACIVSGLNRLPVHSGVAAVWGVNGPTGPRRYRSGDVLVDHGLLDAVANPSQRIEGVTEYLIWSVTGRRVEVADRVAVATEERVLFAPGTPFRVLAVADAEGDHPQQVLLQEMAGPAADQEIAGLRPSVLSQLERAAANLRVLPVSHQVTA